jgi:replication-associated recombination protein RarA
MIDHEILENRLQRDVDLQESVGFARMIPGNERETDWAQRYRPQSLEDCVLPLRIKVRLEKMVNKCTVENLICYGDFGVGKTATATALCRDAGLEVYSVNGSLEGGIGNLRNSVEPFACTRSFYGSRKVVLFDE